MYDSTTAVDIPANAQMVAGYVNGLYKWSEADWSRFLATTVRVTIAVTIDADAMVLDVESGDATPDQAPGWAARQRASGRAPSIYCNLANVDAVRAAFANAGVPLPSLWLAHYDNIAQIPDGYIAKQYADQALTGGHYDASVVADYWPGVDSMTEAQVQAMIDASLAKYGAALQTQLDNTQNLSTAQKEQITAALAKVAF